jgi:tRNA dimethylallyltransferase
LAARFDFEIVSADAMQVYRSMDIGTAKATLDERARVPHHLIDIADPDEPFSVARWVPLAEAAIADILGRGRLPLIVGGTGFYLRALTEGLPTSPPADLEAQAPLWARFERDGLAPLLADLRRAAPTDAERTQRNPRRVIRALEVLQRTGRPPSAFPRTQPRYRYRKAILLPPLSALRPRIHERTGAMFAAGLVTEVAQLLARYPDRLTATQAIGYKEVVDHLNHEATLEEAMTAVETATVKYAKRQRTWFRREDVGTDGVVYEGVAEEGMGVLERWVEG